MAEMTLKAVAESCRIAAEHLEHTASLMQLAREGRPPAAGGAALELHHGALRAYAERVRRAGQNVATLAEAEGG